MAARRLWSTPATRLMGLLAWQLSGALAKECLSCVRPLPAGFLDAERKGDGVDRCSHIYPGLTGEPQRDKEDGTTCSLPSGRTFAEARNVGALPPGHEGCSTTGTGTLHQGHGETSWGLGASFVESGGSSRRLTARRCTGWTSSRATTSGRSGRPPHFCLVCRRARQRCTVHLEEGDGGHRRHAFCLTCSRFCWTSAGARPCAAIKAYGRRCLYGGSGCDDRAEHCASSTSCRRYPYFSCHGRSPAPRTPMPMLDLP